MRVSVKKNAAVTREAKKKKINPLQTLRKHYSEQDQETISRMGFKIIDIISDKPINHAVMALEIAKSFLEDVIDELKEVTKQ
jgi:Ran GTPase-activating protein (RanGAP) involved in mRNA processing and transport